MGIGGIGATRGVDDHQGASKNDTNRKAVCVGLCRRLPAWGVLGRERQMYYKIRKGADAVGATSGHCVRACAVDFYQDQVARGVAVPESAGPPPAQRLGASNLQSEEKPSRTRFHARCGARGVAMPESTEPPPAQFCGNSHGGLYDLCARHA